MENILNIELTTGTVQIQMMPEIAPRHISQITKLANDGFYDGLTFHRVIDGFMAQGGCPIGNGTGGSGLNIPAEFSTTRHERGVCSMARSQPVDSADSQFFICLADAFSLDNQYTVWGKVIEGMEHVDNIKKGNQADNGLVTDPDSIIKMWVDNPTGDWEDTPIKIVI